MADLKTADSNFAFSPIEEIIADTASIHNAEFSFDVVSSREPGGIDVGHPLVRSCRQIMEKLNVPTTIRPSMSEVSELIARGLPSVTLGITEASNLHDLSETIQIKPIYTGLAQLLAVILAIDGGFCNDPE